MGEKLFRWLMKQTNHLIDSSFPVTLMASSSLLQNYSTTKTGLSLRFVPSACRSPDRLNLTIQHSPIGQTNTYSERSGGCMQAAPCSVTTDLLGKIDTHMYRLWYCSSFTMVFYQTRESEFVCVCGTSVWLVLMQHSNWCPFLIPYTHIGVGFYLSARFVYFWLWCAR